MGAPRRRHDDLRADIDPDDVERFYASLPKVVARLRRGRIQNLATALFTLVAMLLLAWLLQGQQRAIEHAAQADREHAYQQCQVANDNARALNQFLDQVIHSVWNSDQLTAVEKRARVAQYQAIKQALPVCTKP